MTACNYWITWCFFFFSSRRRHTRSDRDWSSDVCSSDLLPLATQQEQRVVRGLSFDGNKAIDDYTLSTAIATSNSSFFASVWWLRWIGFLGEDRKSVV